MTLRRYSAVLFFILLLTYPTLCKGIVILSISLFSHFYYTCLPLQVLILWTPSLVYLPCDMCHITYGQIISGDMSLSHGCTGISSWLCINMAKQCLMISMTHCLMVI